MTIIVFQCTSHPMLCTHEKCPLVLSLTPSMLWHHMPWPNAGSEVHGVMDCRRMRKIKKKAYLVSGGALRVLMWGKELLNHLTAFIYTLRRLMSHDNPFAYPQTHCLGWLLACCSLDWSSLFMWLASGPLCSLTRLDHPRTYDQFPASAALYKHWVTSIFWMPIFKLEIFSLNFNQCLKSP